MRLAYPPAVATNTNMSAWTTASASSRSPTLNRIPSTPEVARPIGRSASSLALNRIDWPSAETSSRSSLAEHSTAPTSSSSSRRLMPIRPPVRLESKSVSRDFFTSPVRVASTRYGAAW